MGCCRSCDQARETRGLDASRSTPAQDALLGVVVLAAIAALVLFYGKKKTAG